MRKSEVVKRMFQFLKRRYCFDFFRVEETKSGVLLVSYSCFSQKKQLRLNYFDIIWYAKFGFKGSVVPSVKKYCFRLCSGSEICGYAGSGLGFSRVALLSCEPNVFPYGFYNYGVGEFENTTYTYFLSFNSFVFQFGFLKCFKDFYLLERKGGCWKIVDSSAYKQFFWSSFILKASGEFDVRLGFNVTRVKPYYNRRDFFDGGEIFRFLKVDDIIVDDDFRFFDLIMNKTFNVYKSLLGLARCLNVGVCDGF